MYKTFYELLNDMDGWLSSIEFPKGMNVKLFNEYAGRYYDACETFYSTYDLDELKQHRESGAQLKIEFITTLSNCMQDFMDKLLKSCFLYGEKSRHPLMLPDLVASRINYLRKLYDRDPDYRRDHVLHSGYVFLWGLWFYKNFACLQKAHECMLRSEPRSPGCIAEDIPNQYCPNKDLRWQFLRQWVLTSIYHDVGYFFEFGKPVKEIYEDKGLRRELVKRYRTIEKMNILDQWRLKAMMKNGYEIPSFRKINYDFIWGNLDIELYKINYPSHPGENHLFSDMWDKCLEDIINIEMKLQKFNHGIYSSKILLKFGNFSTKMLEIADQYNTNGREKEPWKRNSYRNFILPAYAILKHDITDDSKVINDTRVYLKNKLQDLLNMGKVDFNISSQAFLTENFLTLLLIICDEIAEFDRIGGKEPIFGTDYKIILPPVKRDNIEFSIVKAEW